MSYSETPFQEEFNALEERFADEVENVHTSFMGYDDDDNPIYESDYTLEEREKNREYILHELADLERMIEGTIDDMYRLKEAVSRYYEEVEEFDIEEDE